MWGGREKENTKLNTRSFNSIIHNIPMQKQQLVLTWLAAPKPRHAWDGPRGDGDGQLSLSLYFSHSI